MSAALTPTSCIGPGKRPLHTIIPALAMRDGRAVMPFGVIGGDYQPLGQAHVLMNMFEYGMDPQQAIDLPRAFHEEGVLRVESFTTVRVCGPRTSWPRSRRWVIESSERTNPTAARKRYGLITTAACSSGGRTHGSTAVLLVIEHLVACFLFFISAPYCQASSGPQYLHSQDAKQLWTPGE